MSEVLPTIKVKHKKYNIEMIINQKDFDKEIHEPLDKKILAEEEEAKKKAEEAAKAKAEEEAKKKAEEKAKKKAEEEEEAAKLKALMGGK